MIILASLLIGWAIMSLLFYALYRRVDRRAREDERARWIFYLNDIENDYRGELKMHKTPYQQAYYQSAIGVTRSLTNHIRTL